MAIFIDADKTFLIKNPFINIYICRFKKVYPHLVAEVECG